MAPRNRTPAAAAQPFADVALTARVAVGSDPAELRASQRDICEALDCSEQTIRNYIRRGLPVHGTAKRPWFIWPETIAWSCYYRHLLRQGGGQAPRDIPFAKAHAWYIGKQAEEAPARFLVVPLMWDHPAREELLRRAAIGIEPDPLDEDDA